MGAPKGRLGSPDDFDAAGKIGVEKFEPWRVAGGRVVDSNAVDEEQGMIGLGTADADLGQRTGRPARRHRGSRDEAKIVGGKRQSELAETNHRDAHVSSALSAQSLSAQSLSAHNSRLTPFGSRLPAQVPNCPASTHSRQRSRVAKASSS